MKNATCCKAYLYIFMTTSSKQYLWPDDDATELKHAAALMCTVVLMLVDYTVDLT
jgi:hypothetical protein